MTATVINRRARFLRMIGLSASTYLYALVALAILVIGIGVVLAALSDRRAAIMEAGRTAETLSTILAEHADRLVETADLVRLQAASIVLQAQSLTASEEQHLALSRIVDQSAHVVSIWIGDERGEAVLTSRVYPTPQLSGSDRAYFTVPRDDPDAIFIGLLPDNRYRDEVLINTSRRLPNASDEFIGFAQVSLSPEYIRALMGRLDVGFDASYWLFGTDDMALMREPLLELDALASMRAASFFNADFPDDDFTISVSPASGEERIYAMQRSPTYGMLAVVGIPLEEALSNWRNSLTAYFLAGAAVIVGLGLLGLMTTQAMRREDAYAAALERRVEQRTTDLQSVVAEKELLLREMGHRVNNVFATVQAVHSQTRRRADDLNAYSRSFEARLAALANAHALVADADGRDAVVVRELLEVELAPYTAPGRVTCEGPEVWLDGRSALTLGLIFHELTTNASKYGCLSSDDGRLRVVWKVSAAGTDRNLSIRWTETGGPPVQQPSRRGFGTILIERSLQPPKGSVMIHYEIDGVQAEIIMRLDPDGQA